MNFKKFIPILSLFILLTLIIGVVSAADASDLEADIDSGIDLSLNNEDFNVDCTAECNDYNTDDNIQNDINLTDNNDLDLSQDSKDTDKELKSSNLASTIVFTEKDYSTYFTKGNLIPSSLNPGDTLDFSGTFTNKNFIINIPLTLTSSSNAQLVDCSIILVTGSDGSVISNLNINTTRLNAPVLNINNVTNVSIINNNIFSSGSGSYGVSLYNVSNSNIFFNDVRTTAFENGRPHPSGILLMGSSYNNISSNNVIVNDSNGIYLSGYGVNLPNSYNYIFNNTVHSVRGVEWELDEDGKTPLPSSFCYAVQIMGSNNQIFNNTVYNAYRGISTESTGNNISGNIVHDIKGTWYSGDTEEDGGDNAIRALGNSIVKHNIVYNCHIKSGGSAVFVGGDSLVYNNSINNIEGNGVYLAQNNINFTNNTLNNISNYGLYVQGAYTNITISNNFINSTDYCIALLKTKKTLYPFDLVIDSNKLYTEKNTAIYYEENCIGNIVITNNEGNVININITRDRVTVSDVTVSPSSVNINDTVVIKPSVTYMGYSVAGTVDIYINGEKETTVDIDSTYEFKPSHAGQFNVSVAFMDEGYYNASVSKAVLLKVLGSTQTTVSLNATNVTVNDSV
ncbi:MAG: right-handed parallel beta-helix repeat-containing protein, partial [Methanosphaera sp.]|nr:right-handed parallel beta-helix repeat-containing protein [Methanosphaera sp.]